jgi:PAS domain S-box-containing protein/putative nucleotidyltransferase with HDIG domain
MAKHCTTNDAIERQQAEGARREGEERYQDLFDSAVEGLCRITPEGKTLAANRAYAHMLGYGSPEEVVAEVVDSAGQVWTGPDERARYVELLREQGSVSHHECQFARRDGTRIWVSVSAKVVGGPDGEPAYFEGFVEDITERRKAEEAARQSEERYEVIFASAPVAISVTRGTELTYANPAYLEMFGVACLEDLQGLAPLALFAPEWHSRFRLLENIRRRADGLPVPVSCEVECLRNDGTKFPVFLQLARTTFSDGPVTVAFLTDITERRQAEEALRESNLQMRSFVEQAPVAISVSSDGACVFANQRLADMLGRGSPDELVGRPTSEFYAAHLQEESKERTRRRSAGLPVPAEFEAVFQRADGSQFPVHVALGLVRLEEVTAHIAFITDISARRAAEEALGELAARLETSAGQWAATFDAMADAVALLGPDGRVLRANAATTSLAGLDMAEIVGHHWREVLSSSAEASAAEASETVCALAHVVEKEGRWLRVYCRPWLDANGQVCGGVQVVSDITQLRQAEQAASERSHFLEELLKAIPVPVYYKDTTLRFVGYNEAYSACLGRSGQDLTGKTVFDLRPAELAGDFDASDRQLLAQEMPSVQEEVQMPSRDGALRDWLCHKAVFSNVAGNSAGIVGVNFDVTEIRQAEKELASAAARLQLSLEGAVAALSATTELRDPYTAGHQRRVAELAVAIALQLGTDAGRTQLLRTAAVLHDIGKIVVPAEILAKPGRLTDVEMMLIRAHAAAGADIVAPIGFDPDVARMVRQHHERLDGSGYPDGLSGSEILPEACILGVADVVEAMVSHRPYRAALPPGAAVGELEKGAGCRYDEAVCRIAISLICEQGFTFTN